MNTKYGQLPEPLGKFEIDLPEYMYILYMPIRFPKGDYVIPSQLEAIKPLLEEVRYSDKDYVYVTVKHMIHGVGSSFNRDGWHSDGYMSDDVNYVWCSNESTHFTEVTVDSSSLVGDHTKDLLKLNELVAHQSQPVVQYPEKTLLRLDQYNIHRAPINKNSTEVERTFIKISVSPDKYNLKGNSRNPLLNYSWDMKERVVELRNDTK